MSQHLLIATAGHVDHGKSTLVRALTGIDPDRWQEEKDRGITIDLGYAHRTENDRSYSFVDVPGHERFLHNMLAGVGSIDAVLLVIAADESIMPQTREHALALHFLRCRQVGIVITKCDLVEDDFLELVHAELDDWLSDFGWQDAPRANVANTQPETLTAVTQLLAQFEPQPLETQTRFRMPIDRVFISQGSGTIVTGSVDCGSLEKTDKVLLQPGELQSRVRQIQVHGQQVERVSAHQRAALNLTDFHHSDMRRGHVLFQSPGAIETQHVLVRLTPFSPWEPSPKHKFHLHHFAKHLLATVTWRQDEFAMLQFAEPHMFWALDRGLIRDGSPLQVTAGFEVIHPAPPTARRKHNQAWIEHLGKTTTSSAWIEAMLDYASLPVASTYLWQLSGRGISAGVKNDLIYFENGTMIHKSRFQALAQKAMSILKQCHQTRPFYDHLPLNWVRSCWEEARIPAQIADTAVQEWLQDNTISLFEDHIKDSQHQPHWQPEQRRQLVQLQEICSQPMPLIDTREFKQSGSEKTAVIQMLIWEKFLVSLTSELLLPSAYINRIAADFAREYAGSILQVSDLKEKLNLSRKTAIPLLELFDKLGYSVREAEGRRWLQTNPEPIISHWKFPLS